MRRAWFDDMDHANFAAELKHRESIRHSMAAVRREVRGREHTPHFRNLHIGTVRQRVTGNTGDAHLRLMQNAPRHRVMP